MAKKSPTSKANDSNQAQEGAQVAGDVNTGGGDFTGRDQITNSPTVEAGGVAGVVLTDVSAGGDIRIEGVYASITYQTVLPQPVDEATVQAAQARLAKLPLDRIPPVATLPPGSQMPYSVNTLFVGREAELQRLAVALQGQQTVAVGQMAAATGLGGIGKTQLAVAFVHHYGQYFAGGVYWLNCADPNAIPNEIATCGLTMPEIRADFANLDIETRVRLVQLLGEVPRVELFARQAAPGWDMVGKGIDGRDIREILSPTP